MIICHRFVVIESFVHRQCGMLSLGRIFRPNTVMGVAVADYHESDVRIPVSLLEITCLT